VPSSRSWFSTPKHSHEHRSARRNIPTSMVRHAETFPRVWFGTPKHSHEPVSVRARRAERRAEPCVRRAEATQSAETSFTAVSADQLETAFRRRTSAEICNGVPNSRRTGVSAPNSRRNGTPERRKTACFGAETAKMPRFSAPKICLKSLVTHIARNLSAVRLNRCQQNPLHTSVSPCADDTRLAWPTTRQD